MANKLILKKSSVATKVPLATDLEVGEIAVNLTDQKLYSKKSDGTVILVGTGLSGTGTVTSVGATVPSFLSVSGSPITTSGTLAIGYSGTALPVANGGTGATTSAGALTSLGAYPATNPNGYTTNTGTVTSVGGTGTVNGISLSGTVTSSGNLTLGGTLSGVNLTSQVTGTLPVANGGTGLTAVGAIGNVLTSDGTNWTSAAPTGGGGSSGFEQTFLLMGA